MPWVVFAEHRGDTLTDGGCVVGRLPTTFVRGLILADSQPAWLRHVESFLAAQERFIVVHRYPMLGEFEVRHHPLPRQVQRGETHRDVDVPIDGPLVERVFQFAQKTGLPCQIHYEIEDRLLDPLEQMLARYPGAKVIWFHLAQVRYPQRSTR